MKRKIIIPLLALSLFALPSTMAKAAGPTYGKSAPYFGGENTYGYSWAGWDNHQCWTQTKIGYNTAEDKDTTWAQTHDCYCAGEWEVYENHSFN